MVEEITNPEELSQVPKLLAAQAERKKELGKADEERGEGCVCCMLPANWNDLMPHCMLVQTFQLSPGK